MKTEFEIAWAIERLTTNKEKSKKLSLLGVDNHKAIDTMICVIKNSLSKLEITALYGDDQDMYRAALDALEFLNGQTTLNDLLIPEYY